MALVVFHPDVWCQHKYKDPATILFVVVLFCLAYPNLLGKKGYVVVVVVFCFVWFQQRVL
jgi:hypothetical protein